MKKATRLSATPLISIDAVSLDTETTGLDTKTARLIQVGALAIHEGVVDAAETFQTLVNPGVSIPPGSTAVHHIDDAMVSDSPSFAAISGALESFIQDRILVGHSIGFDIAILEREHKLAGLPFHRPRTLCTAILSRIALPDMPEHSLDTVAARLGVTVTERHSAMGDALTTAGVFLALVPYLRERNIRTLAEAEAACRGMTEILDEHYRAGWAEPVSDRKVSLSEKALARLDAYPYRHRAGEVMSRPPIAISGNASIQQALTLLADKRISAAIVSERSEPEAADAGIVTERDLLRALARDGASAFQRPISEIASRPVECVYEDAYLYRAIGRMSRRNIRHLGVKNEDGIVVGVLSQRDLLRLRATDAISLGDEIDSAAGLGQLGAAWARLPLIARGLLAEGADGREIAGIVSRELGAITRRAAELAVAAMKAEGKGEAPVPYALLVLGSGGRGESMLAPDQDNAIVYANTERRDEADLWFADLATRVADTLNAVGIPYCKGGIMASQPVWRRTLGEWEETIADWIRRSRPEDLLNVDIFYDFRAVHGDAALARQLWNTAHEAAGGEKLFAQLLAKQAEDYSPPVGFFGGIRTENGRVDLKKGGLFPIVTLARALAIRHSVAERSTRARLEGLLAREIGGAQDLGNLIRVHAMLMDLIVAQQLDDIAEGLPPGNAIDPKKLKPAQQSALREALSSLGNIAHLARDLMS
ncbi:MAG: CBS domain-containing protein [Rhodobiaceae bacterium]|nr:CBS domain-containing protein [Rhodobiaceae bacterium]MCC0055059.1 CBS domain-containing protein [Rhodobiaceae bacterium]